MNTDKRAEVLVGRLYNAVVNYNEEKSREISKAILDEGIDAYYAVTYGLTAAMDRVGELYSSREYFVPELLLCADALYAGLEILRPNIKISGSEKRRKIVIGTVEGDIHDIGKNLVKIMFEAAGWIVYDLGNDVQLSKFAEEQKKTQADVVALSALMTTSMLAIPKAVEMIRAQSPDVTIMVGGAPLSLEIAKEYGADGYADDAGKAVPETLKTLNSKTFAN